MAVTIEKNIPLPSHISPKWSFYKEMEIGDSVLLETREYNRTTALTEAIRYGIKIKTRSVENAFRVWRIA